MGREVYGALPKVPTPRVLEICEPRHLRLLCPSPEGVSKECQRLVVRNGHHLRHRVTWDPGGQLQVPLFETILCLFYYYKTMIFADAGPCAS